MKIAIVDYSLGNLFSVQQAFEVIGIHPVITHDQQEILDADGVVLPGVGSFGAAMQQLRNLRLDSALHDIAQSGKPLLGICLGMQLLFESSEEFGHERGLGILPGTVSRLPEEQVGHIPQIGWNRIRPASQAWEGTILEGIPSGAWMYFVHSYFVSPTDLSDILTLTTYEGFEYCSAVRRGNIVATQFHPEKSGEPGLSMYSAWIRSIQS